MTLDELLDDLGATAATIIVEPYEGTGAYGPAYGAPVTVTACWVDDKRRRVRVQTQDAAGAEVTSETTVLAPPDTVAPPGSRVTLPSGRVTRVLVASHRDGHGLDVPSHLELALE